MQEAEDKAKMEAERRAQSNNTNTQKTKPRSKLKDNKENDTTGLKTKQDGS